MRTEKYFKRWWRNMQIQLQLWLYCSTGHRLLLCNRTTAQFYITDTFTVSTILQLLIGLQYVHCTILQLLIRLQYVYNPTITDTITVCIQSYNYWYDYSLCNPTITDRITVQNYNNWLDDSVMNACSLFAMQSTSEPSSPLARLV